MACSDAVEAVSGGTAACLIGTGGVAGKKKF